MIDAIEWIKTKDELPTFEKKSFCSARNTA